jgi:hypothetical protein
MSDTIACPGCGTEIEVTEVLSGQLRQQLRREFDGEARRKEDDIKARELKLAGDRTLLEDAQKTVEQQVTTRLAAERANLVADALLKAKEDVSVELQDTHQQLADAKTKLKTAQQTELDLRRERSELAEQKEQLELSVQRRMDEERSKIRDGAKKEAEQERQLKDAEKDKLINDLHSEIENLRRKSEQGSQQLQGEVLELQMEDLLRRHFPYDEITPVPKGQHGGDCVQTVRDVTGMECGFILWESKRTKSWSDGWLPKLRDDQRAAKAQMAVLVSIELPKDLKTFDLIDGVWVTSRPCAIGLAAALRAGLIELSKSRQSQDGRQGKMELLYNYLSGQEFRHRVEGIVEAFDTLRQDLEAEKRAMQKVWAKREKQLDRAVLNTAGLYGDLSGIIGATLPAIEKLEFPRIADVAAPDQDDRLDSAPVLE